MVLGADGEREALEGAEERSVIVLMVARAGLSTTFSVGDDRGTELSDFRSTFVSDLLFIALGCDGDATDLGCCRS